MDQKKIDDIIITFSGTFSINEKGELIVANYRHVRGFFQMNWNLLIIGEYI